MAKAKKFGTFGGVFTPSILTLLGVIMYLRLPWIVGQAGLFATLGIIFVAHIISICTGLSVSSIATDKKVETGGTYYIISRSLGLPIGGTLGLALFVGLSFSVSLYLIGFAEVFLEYFGFEVNLTTIRIAGSIILLLVTILTFISTSLTIKTQFFILAAMILSLASVFLGKHEYTPALPQFKSISGSLSWITLFAIFFPAVTGFEAGVSMSGDLKDPRKGIPIGTISAILVGLITYIGLAVFFSFTVNRDLLINDPKVLFKISLVPQLVIAGILGATLSSAFGSILAAPRIMQAVAKDRIAPFFFSKGFGASNEPRHALLLTFLIAQAGILIGELNVIARIVTIFFIITYGFLNITYSVESWASSDFMPSFKIPRIVSITGALACIIVMIQLDILALGLASLVLMALFFYLKNKELTLHTGDTRSSIWLSLVKTGLLKLTKSQINSRNWRPNVILFSGGPKQRPHLIEIGKALVGKLGIFTNFELVETPDENLLFDKTAMVSVDNFGEHTNIITRKYACRNIYEGIEMISKVYGFSGFEPNTVLMGWAKNARDSDKLEELIFTLHRLDYSLTFLSYNKDHGFGNYNKIDFWWSGKGRNLTFALHLIRFITVTPHWRNAEVRILAINPESKNTDKYYAIIGQFIDNYRIRASVKVINNLEKLPEKDVIRAESYNSDLTILEISGNNKDKAESVINKVNEVTGSLKTCLLIDASSGFEEINVIKGSPVKDREKLAGSQGEKPVVSILGELQISKIDIIFNEVYNLAQLLEKNTNVLFDDTFFTIEENRNNFQNQLSRLTEKTLDKLIKAGEPGIQQEKKGEYLKILNDFSYHAQENLAEYRDNYLKSEHEILQKGISRFISETTTAVNSLPKYIRLMFGKEDYRHFKPGSFIKLLKKTGIILWLSISGKKTGYNINVQPAGRYYIYYKRLEYFRQFYDKFTEQSLTTFADIRDLLTGEDDIIEKTRSGKLTNNELFSEQEKISTIVKKLQFYNRNFIYSQGHKMLSELRNDLESFSKIIESPRANFFSRRFKSFDKKILKLENLLSEFPDLWFRFTVSQVNKTYLDFIYLSLKSRLISKIEKACQDIEILIEVNILEKLKVFEEQVKSIREFRDTGNHQERVFNQKFVPIPQVEEIFEVLIKDINKAVEELPEYIEIAGDILPENIRIETLENITEFIVSVRKTADFYISNELCDQIKKQSLKIGQQLSFSITAIKDLIKLANFNLENPESNINDEAENRKSEEQFKILTENLLKNIKTEELNLKDLSEQLRHTLDTGVKNAFDPLSSAIIIKTSTTLKEKIRETDKRRFSRSLQKLTDLVGDNVINQYVKLLYSQSDGLLWATRIEQSREKALLYPGDSFSRILEKISPDKTILQQLPFYYSNLFSGSSSIGEDFWIGMEDETEQGSRAIRLFLSGTSGALIISGERSSGKSSISKHLANLHFEKQNIFNIRAPLESIADATLFEQTLLKSLNGKGSLKTSLEDLPPECVIIINDLELWWERKPSGTQVVEKIISLIRQYGHKILFIINVNQSSLKIINQMTSIISWAIGLVFCQPFDARELKDLIMIRHQATGMKFILNKKDEDEMTNREFARLFNRIFNLSTGNPGYAINLWLAGIRKISGKTIYLENPLNKEIPFPDKLPQDEIIFILQFIMHRRFSVKSLSEILQKDFESTEKSVRIMLRKGIITEKFPDVYSLNPALEIHLVKKLKTLELL